MRFKKYLFILIFIISLSFFSFSVLNSSYIVNFEFYTYKGEKYSLKNFKGKYILLNLFTSYCPMCLIELNTLNKLNNSCKSDGYKIISLLVDKEGITLLPKIVNSRNITYTVGIAPSEIYKIFPDFSITPTTYILNQNGNLVERVVGYKSLKEWIKILNKYVRCN
ncbi:MAG: hypothetical protein C0190_06230 [Thermodesulfobacterium geofontis]|uniref:Thioredoxin domain-containing protein n=1 Tax=Thermodesulfobacterium geofontis TaxID=1295609 RepID=A0A2N7PM85_9BACT|nr:MAG: hypothetical protein C0190_06230 [Thermodesulfobacterium geofontis]